MNIDNPDRMYYKLKIELDSGVNVFYDKEFTCCRQALDIFENKKKMYKKVELFKIREYHTKIK